LNAPLRQGKISGDEREATLFAMTDEVADLVLQDNYDQTAAISVSKLTATQDAETSARFVRDLEKRGRLQREVEKLPSDETFRELTKTGKGLTRPELAVLLAYAKLDLLANVVASELPDDPWFEALLAAYFPPRAAEGFKDELGRHRLRREIITTQLVNRAVNLAGPLYAFRMRELSNAEPWLAVRAFAIADGAFNLSQLKARIDALDLHVAADVQYRMLADIGGFLRRMGRWYVAHLTDNAALAPIIKLHREGAESLKAHFPGPATGVEAENVAARLEILTAAGAPEDIARDIALLPLLGTVPDIALLAESCGVPFEAATTPFFAVGETARLGQLRAQLVETTTADHWDRLALRRIYDDLFTAQRLMAAEALRDAEGAGITDGRKAVEDWAVKRSEALARAIAFFAEFEQSETPSVGKLSLANSEIQKLAAERG